MERDRDAERRQREQLEEALDRQTEKLRRRNAELETHLQAAWTQLEALRGDDRLARQRRQRFRLRREPDLIQDR